MPLSRSDTSLASCLDCYPLTPFLCSYAFLFTPDAVLCLTCPLIGYVYYPCLLCYAWLAPSYDLSAVTTYP